MRIAVIDVAAENGGALSVLHDFIKYIESDNEFCRNNTWILYTSIPMDVNNNNACNKVVTKVKKGWAYRYAWEQFDIKPELEKERINFVISLQNTAIKKGNYYQIVFFHNVLLLESVSKYYLLKKNECKYAIYTRLISPYTLHSLRNADYVLCQTETVKKELQKRISQTNIRVVQPNINIEPGYRDTALLPIKGLVYPTSAIPFKRVEEIIECVKQYKDWFEYNEFEILFTISGNENTYAQELLRYSEDVRSIIRFIGRQSREDLFDLYKEYGLIICSEMESFSLPFIEAGFIGTPIVAANYPYAVERTEKFNNAFLYQPGNYKEMFDSIMSAQKVSKVSHNSIEQANNTWNIIQTLSADLH